MRRLVLVTLVAVALLGACGSAPELPQLPPLSASGAARHDNAMAGGITPISNVRYELADGVTTDVDHAHAYRYPAHTIDDARRVASAFGYNSSDVHEDSGGWSIGPTGSPNTVAFRSSLFVGSNGTFSINGVTSGVACTQMQCATTTTTADPTLPADDEARSIAIGKMKSAGVDTDRTSVTVKRYADVVTVSFEPTYGGTKTVSMNECSVSIGGGDAILSAFGVLGSAQDVGSYELATLQRAVDRLNQGSGDGGTEATILKLTGVSVGLMGGADTGQLWVVPAYVFTVDASSNGPVITPAAADKYLQSSTQPTTSTTAISAIDK